MNSLKRSEQKKESFDEKSFVKVCKKFVNIE